jgi:microcystin-dependent protein
MAQVQKEYQYCNNSESPIQNVLVNIPAESGYTYVSYSATSGSYSPTNKVWNIPSASAETCYTLVITYTVSAQVLCEDNCSKEATAAPVNINHGNTHTIRGVIPCASLCTEGTTLIEITDQSGNVSATVDASSGNYTVTITDITYNWFFDYTIQCIHCDEVTEPFGPARVEGKTPEAPLLPYFSGEIRMFSGDTAPTGWAFCDGTLLGIVDEPTLYGVIGTTYGGDGVTTFALPDFRGRMPIGVGTGTGLTARALSDVGGDEEIILVEGQLPPHSHNVEVTTNTEVAGFDEAANNVLGKAAANIYSALAPNPGLLLGGVVEDMVGNSDPVNVMNPFLAINFIIAIKGFNPL